MNLFFNILVYIVWFAATFYTIYFFLVFVIYKDKLYEKKKLRKDYNPFVTLLIPAYNEEKSIADTIESLKNITYSHIEFIILSDGSRDCTARMASDTIAGDKRFTLIDNKVNKGKAATLNQGIAIAKGEFIACLDADSIVEPGIIEKVLPYFYDKKTGAVTVSVEVRNPKTFLHRIIATEFALGLSLFLKIFSHVDCVFVTPGPFSMYRKSMLEEIGGYDPTNITEDHEIAFRIHKSKYKIKNCMDAKVYTTLPDTFKQIYVQRRRWYAGAIQTMVKHKDMLFNKKYQLFGYYLPLHYILISLGFITAVSSVYLTVNKFIREILYYKYTNFNFFDHLKFAPDFLTLSRVSILGLSLFIVTILLMVTGIIYTKKRLRDYNTGLLGYPFMFFLYQIYWGGAFFAVIKNKKIKWR